MHHAELFNFFEPLKLKMYTTLSNCPERKRLLLRSVVSMAIENTLSLLPCPVLYPRRILLRTQLRYWGFGSQLKACRVQ